MNDAPISFFTPGEIQRSLAARVRGRRLGIGWTQRNLATRAGVSLPTLQRYEQTGRTSVQNLLKICHALGRLDEFDRLLRPPPAASLAELQARGNPRVRKRARP